MNLLFLGAGGVGGYYGARLIQAGANVTFLVRPARRAALAEHGLMVTTPEESFSLPVRAETIDTLQDGHFDLLVFSPKAYDLEAAIATLRQVPGTPAILPLLNGVDHFALLDSTFGRARVLGGVAHISAMLDKNGVVHRLSALQRFTFGARHPDQQTLVANLAALCAQARFESIYSENIEQVLWEKWVYLATLAGMTTLMQAPTGQIIAAPFGAQAMRAFYAECCAVATQQGHGISASASQAALDQLLQAGSPAQASMLRDMQAGNRTEHEHILGALARRAEAAGLPAPLLSLAYTRMAVHAAAAKQV